MSKIPEDDPKPTSWPPPLDLGEPYSTVPIRKPPKILTDLRVKYVTLTDNPPNPDCIITHRYVDGRAVRVTPKPDDRKRPMPPIPDANWPRIYDGMGNSRTMHPLTRTALELLSYCHPHDFNHLSARVYDGMDLLGSTHDVPALILGLFDGTLQMDLHETSHSDPVAVDTSRFTRLEFYR